MPLQRNSIWTMHKCGVIFFCLVVIGCTKKDPKIDLTAHNTNLALFSPGFVSTAMNERDIAISKDGSHIVYTLSNADNTKRSLVEIKKSGDSWNEPSVTSFSGVHNDIEPFSSQDGKRLYFASDRPIERHVDPNYNLWMVNFDGDSWDEPKEISVLINTEKDEFYPSLSSNGNLYFTASYANSTGREDIYFSTLTNDKYVEAVPLGSEINSIYFEFNAYISPDENLLIFSSFGKDDDIGGGDLYMSRKNQDGTWEKSKHLGSRINSSFLDYCPFVDFNHRVFYFTSKRSNSSREKQADYHQLVHTYDEIENGLGNIYRYPLDSLLSLK